MERVECIVAGAGVIGLAIARSLALAGREVLVIEAESAIGTQTSSRNSEVIHAGLYYPARSAKARHCVEGRVRLYRFLQERGIAHSRCGKLIVAEGAAEEAKLLSIRRSAQACGVGDLVALDRDTVARLEPHVRASAALLSPSTGIIDSHAYMLALQADAEAAGAEIAFQTIVLGGRREGNYPLF